MTDDLQTSNICDVGYVGPAQTVQLFGPLLQKPSENPHATLVTPFMNAIGKMGNIDPDASNAELAGVMRYKTMQDMLSVDPKYNYWITMAVMPLGINLERIFAE